MRESIKLLGLKKRSLAILVLTIIVTASFSIIVPISFGLIVDTLLPLEMQNHIQLLCTALVILIFLRFALNLIQDLLFQKVRMDAERFLTRRFVQRVLDFPSGVHNESVNFLRLWLVNFQYQFTEILFFFAYAIFIASLVFSLIIVIAPSIAFICAAFLVLHAINFFFHYSRSQRASSDYAVARSHFTDSVQAVLTGKRTVNIASVETRTLDRISNLSEISLKSATQREQIAASQYFYQSLLRGGLILLIVMLSYPKIVNNEFGIGSLFTILLMINFAYEPIYRLSATTKLWNQLNSYLTPINSFLNCASFQQSDKQQVLPTQTRSIELDIAGLNYSLGGRRLFHKFSAQINANRLTLICGPSGRGKTTLLELIATLVKPELGTVFWGDLDANRIPKSEKSKLLHYVPQSPAFFNESLDCNISLFDPVPDQERVNRSLTELGFNNEQIRQLRSDFRPETLSLGQRQRLALARSLYSNAPIILLDEPTANLDSKTEQHCLEVIKQQTQFKTIVMVSHSKSSQRVADNLIRLTED